MTNMRPPQQGAGCASGCVGSGLARLLGRRSGQVQELMHGLDRFGAIGAREQHVVADSVEKPLGRTWMRKRPMNSSTVSEDASSVLNKHSH
jgi:hypothetical protein